MPISDFPILSMLRTRMQWHGAEVSSDKPPCLPRHS